MGLLLLCCNRRQITARITVVLTLIAAPLWAQTRVTRPFAGLTYIDRAESLPRPLHMHIVQVDLTTPGLRFKVSPPSGSRETVRQTTLEFLRTEKAQAAINSHFFLPFPSQDTESWLIGLAASEGVVYSAFEAPEQSFAIVADAPAVNIDAQNRATIVHRDPSDPTGTRVREAVALWNVVSGSAQIVSGGAVTIPEYADATHANGLLTPGGPGHRYSNQYSWYDVPTARSALGLSRDGRTLTMFTVDVRGDSQGMLVGEVARWLIRDYGVWNAINLDGGGSTSLALEDPQTGVARIVNTSSDNPNGRSVASSLAVFARKRD
jgi:hypothetical protein